MKNIHKSKSEDGFSLMELLLSILIMVPIMAAGFSLFSVGANEQAAEQSSINANQEVRSALELMASEIAQAGSNRDRTITLSAAITDPDANPNNPQSVAVSSTAGLRPGDYVDVMANGTANPSETVKIQAVGSTTITASFRWTHPSGTIVRLFAFPFVHGVPTPAGLGVNDSTEVTTIGFFGDINSDLTGSSSELQYIEYAYDKNNAQITRSATPISAGSKSSAVPFVRNVKDDSVTFTLHTDSYGTVTSVDIEMTVLNTWKTASQYQETALATRVVIPSATAGSLLYHEFYTLGGINKIPPTPTNVLSWAGLGGTQ